MPFKGQSPPWETYNHSGLYPSLETSNYSRLPLPASLPRAPSLPTGNSVYSRQPVASETGAPSYPTADRPASIQELADRVKVDWDAGADIKRYLRIAEKHRRDGKDCAKRGDLETAFVSFAHAATLVLEKLPEHKDYHIVLNANQRQNLALNGEDILENLAEIKPKLMDRYDQWMMQQYAEDGIPGRSLGERRNVPTASVSNNGKWYNASQNGPIERTKTPTVPTATWANVNDNRGWDSLVDSYSIGMMVVTSSMMESPTDSSTVIERVDPAGSLSQSGNSSFSATLSNIKTEDLTGSVRRDGEYPAHGGGYADVYVGTLTRKERTMKVAIKVIRSHTYTAANQWKIDKRLRREILLWSCLRHPNVVPLLGTTTGFGAYPAMVCPWMKDGNLSHYLSHRKQELSLRKRLHIMADIIEGLAYLHSQPVIHGDLTTGNILMDEGKAHLSDFGLSNVMIEVRNSSFMSSTVSGAPRWTAPELLHVGTGIPDVTKHCDIYSFGSVMLQTVTGRIPYENIALDVQVLMEVMRGGTPARPPEPLLSDALWDLIASCWSRDPFARPEIGQVRERLHVLRYSFSEEELTANIVDSERSLEQDEGEHSGPWAH